MLEVISSCLKKVAEEIFAADDSLTIEDVKELDSRAPSLVKMVKKNIDNDSDPFKGLTDEDKRHLLAFVVYKRQNITTEIPIDKPNEEDAAKILHCKVYPTEGTSKERKKSLKSLEEDLKKQLSKAGLVIK